MLVYVGGEVLRSTRDKLAVLARSQGRTVAALVRQWAEQVTETYSADPVDLGDAPRISIRLPLGVARALEKAAAEHHASPASYTTAVLEAHLLNRVHWDGEHLKELRAIRVLLADAKDDIRRDKVVRHLDAVIAGNLSYWSAIAPPQAPEAVPGSGQSGAS